MSFETDLDTAFTILLGKAQGTVTQTGTPGGGGGGGTTVIVDPRPASVAFEFSGGGASLTAVSQTPILVEIPFAATLVWVHIFAGNITGQPVSASATFDIQYSNFSSFGGSSDMRQGGAIPQLSGQSSANINLGGWKTDLDAGTTIIVRLVAITGSATWATVSLQLRPAAAVFATLVDASGNALTDDFGNVILGA